MEKFYLIADGTCAKFTRYNLTVTKRSTLEEAQAVAESFTKDVPTKQWLVFELVGVAKTKDSPVVFVEPSQA